MNNHPYHTPTDLLSIGKLIRRAFSAAPSWNAWSFARFDIWAQRAIADEQVFDKTGWQPNIHLWRDRHGELLGAAFFEREGGHSATLVSQPDQRDLLPDMLDWIEAHDAAQRDPDKPLIVECTDDNLVLQALLQSRGYTKPDAGFIARCKTLDASIVEPVRLPPGYSLKPIETLDELKKFHAAVQVVFNFMDNVDVYRIVQQAPSFMPELGLIVLDKCGDVASFCTLWVDWHNSQAEFEPVGTLPAHQQRGLGSALLAEGHNRLRLLGIHTSTVYSWSESAGANKLYQNAGLLPRDCVYDWRR